MHEVIQEVLATEAEARRLVQEATVQASSLVSRAQAEAGDLMERVRRETSAEAKAILESTLQAAAQHKQAQLERLAVEIDSQYRLDTLTRQSAIDAVVRCVCGET